MSGKDDLILPFFKEMRRYALIKKRTKLTIFYFRIDAFLFLLIHRFYKPKKWKSMRSLDKFDVIYLLKYTLLELFYIQKGQYERNR
jgi:hypothetical protein